MLGRLWRNCIVFGAQVPLVFGAAADAGRSLAAEEP